MFISKLVLVLISVMWISINISLIYAQTIEVNFPNNVDLEQEFDFSIELVDFEENIYDVKIEITNGTRNIAKVLYNEEWKSTYYWIKDAINSSESLEKNFKIKIMENYEGINNFVVKIKSSNFDEQFTGYELTIGENNEDGGNEEGWDGNEDNGSENEEIVLKLNWDEEDMINQEEFEIKVLVENLENRGYDIKIWIEDNGEIISERYDNREEEWKSGNYYINNFFKGSGDEEDSIKLRIKEDYSYFKGETELRVRIREEDASSHKKEVLEYIEILEKESGNDSDSSDNQSNSEADVDSKDEEKAMASNGDVVTGQIIRLGSKKNEIKPEQVEAREFPQAKVYESDSEIIKKYSIYGFAFLCVIFLILLIWGKLK